MKSIFRALTQRTVGVREPMPFKKNLFVRNGKALVAIEKSSHPIDARVKAAVDMMGGIHKVIKKGDTVLLKPNFVFPQPPPCTTAPDFLTAVIKLCYEAGASRVAVGESAAYWVDTESTMKKLDVIQSIQKAGAEIIYFDQGKWIDVALNTPLIKKVSFPESAFQFDKIIFLPNLKTHHLARFTMSLKLAYGFLSQRYRTAQLHFLHLEKKIAEVNTAIHPDLIIIDARQCFVTGGPAEGDIEKPNLILASGDRIAIDAVGVKILQRYQAKNKLIYENPFQYEQIKHAAELGLGVASWKAIKKVE
ncbi:DUF362 domain-containing protein [Candidatus Woesearchaeota archaeon]|nr:DUF362 domain-containing protein [Candidatus Woesearchaeota archaeon]